MQPQNIIQLQRDERLSSLWRVIVESKIHSAHDEELQINRKRQTAPKCDSFLINPCHSFPWLPNFTPEHAKVKSYCTHPIPNPSPPRDTYRSTTPGKSPSSSKSVTQRSHRRHRWITGKDERVTSAAEIVKRPSYPCIVVAAAEGKRQEMNGVDDDGRAGAEQGTPKYGAEVGKGEDTKETTWTNRNGSLKDRSTSA